MTECMSSRVHERENYYDEYIVDDAALKEQLVEMFYREVE